MYRRCCQYIYDFKNRSIGHLNDYLFNSMSKYGLNDFEFFPLEFCLIEHCESKELKWILKLKSNIRDFGFNIRLDSTTGMIVSNETSKKISNNLREQWANGVRDGHSDKMKKKWLETPKRKKLQSKVMSRVLTKWVYDIEYPDGQKISNVLYKELQSLGFGSAISNFHRKKLDIVNCKGSVITRRSV